jgi:hypothetical protein
MIFCINRCLIRFYTKLRRSAFCWILIRRLAIYWVYLIPNKDSYKLCRSNKTIISIILNRQLMMNSLPALPSHPYPSPNPTLNSQLIINSLPPLPSHPFPSPNPILNRQLYNIEFTQTSPISPIPFPPGPEGLTGPPGPAAGRWTQR